MDVRVFTQRVNNPRKTHLLHRGDFLQPADEVAPGTLATLPPVKGSTRLDLARWLVSAEHPLTPRVTVNHFWTRLFGEGLVHTVADFGVRGDAPTHAALLDWLSREFIRQGWSRKHLLKTIMLSATYRQSSVIPASLPPKVMELDPRNALLWRQNRLRVEGEIVRDLYLAASGLLSSKIGGPSVFPPMPEDIAALSYANNFKWTTSKGEDRHRRGMYTLNAESFAEAAQALAKRVWTEKDLTDDAARLARAFHLSVARAPRADELQSLTKLLQESRYTYQNGSAEDAKAACGLHAAPGVPAAENAAWVAVTRIILNLDEVITRD
jgi:hypothetical protein